MTTKNAMADYLEHFDKLMGETVFGVSQKDKEALLLPALLALHRHHQAQSTDYARIVDADIHSSSQIISHLSDFPYLAVRLFKQLELFSIKSDDIFKVLRSSGTTSQQPATIYLDKETSSRQSKVLVKILQQRIGRQRLPMLIIDSPAVLENKAAFNARAAGIQGMAFFGRDLTYALDQNMQPNWTEIEAFHRKYADQPVLMFGFTYMVWLYFVQALQQKESSIRFKQGTLLHSGGWKKLEDQKVDNAKFKQVLAETTGINQCFNFYGMAEQVGSIFVECEKGHLHAPIFADLIVRDPYTLKQSAIGQPGLIQVLSCLPTSYPGHSLLTEDLGTILGADDCPCGEKGKYFSVHGRLPKTEVRGCSDTHQAKV